MSIKRVRMSIRLQFVTVWRVDVSVDKSHGPENEREEMLEQSSVKRFKALRVFAPSLAPID